MASIAPKPQDPGFGVYVHWPFCLAKCPYCDFNSHVRRGSYEEDRYLNAILIELKHRAALTKGRVVRSIFFGGGTPSLMSPDTVARIIEAVGQELEARPPGGDHARSQSDQRRGDAFRRLSGGGGQSRVGGRAGAQ